MTQKVAEHAEYSRQFIVKIDTNDQFILKASEESPMMPRAFILENS